MILKSEKSPKQKLTKGARCLLTAGASVAAVLLVGEAAEQGVLGTALTDGVRRAKSLAQSGTQVYFDEARYKTGIYSARVTAFQSGRRLTFGGAHSIRGSTLPDGASDFPVVADQTVRFERGTHYGTVKNPAYGATNVPALILNPGNAGVESQGRPVRTIRVNRSPYAGPNHGLRQASQIHVHPGFSEIERGSAGCLTLAPDDSKAFFESEIGRAGRIHINR